MLDDTYTLGSATPTPPSTTDNGDHPTPTLLDGLRNGKWLDQQDFPPLVYTVPGVLPEGFTLLVGAPKIGKSWWVLALAIAAAHGGHALGHLPVQQRPVLYLALEDGDRRLQDRCRRLLDGDPIPGFDYLTRVQPGQVIATVAEWLELHGDQRPVVVLDTLGKVMPPALQGETTYGRDYRIGSALKRLADDYPGTSIVVNHHDRKAASEDFVEMVSGTNGLAGSADSIVVLTRPRGASGGTLHVTGRDVPDGEYALTFDGAAWCLDGNDLDEAAQRAQEARTTVGLGDRSAEVAGFVNARPDGTRAAQVAVALDIDQATARTYLARLAESGRISRSARGLYTPVVNVASVTSLREHESERNTRNSNNTPRQACMSCGDSRPVNPNTRLCADCATDFGHMDTTDTPPEGAEP